jgi:hypothetical protein
MRRCARLFALVTLTVCALPGQALAAESTSSASFGVHIGVSLLGLIVSVVLLVEALGLRKIALGGVIGQKMSLVVLAVICLAGSALAEWGTNFVVDLTRDQVQLASQVLVVVAMALLASYFYNVRAGMNRFITQVSSAAPVVADSTTASSDDRGHRG